MSSSTFIKPFPSNLPETSKSFQVSEVGYKEIILSPVEGTQDIFVSIEAEMKALVVLAGSATEKTYSRTNLKVDVAKGASCDCVVIFSGGAQLETHLEILLAGEGANAKITGIGHGEAEQQHSLQVQIHHVVPHTQGNVFFRGVYEANAKINCGGLLKILPEAQQTESYFRNDILLLDHALALSTPTLEIGANDVKASHGSTTSRLDIQQLFYLQSRGLSLRQARQLIIAGFFSPALARVPAAFCKPFQPNVA
jgi:Fe-S cluster assembly protein SufD